MADEKPLELSDVTRSFLDALPITGPFPRLSKKALGHFRAYLRDLSPGRLVYEMIFAGGPHLKDGDILKLTALCKNTEELYRVERMKPAKKRGGGGAASEGGGKLAEPGAKLPPCVRKAANSYREAAQSMTEHSSDKDVWEWLTEHGSQAYDLGKPPDFNTWARYLREWRRRTGQSRNARRAGRTGRSIITAEEDRGARAGD